MKEGDFVKVKGCRNKHVIISIDDVPYCGTSIDCITVMEVCTGAESAKIWSDLSPWLTTKQKNNT